MSSEEAKIDFYTLGTPNTWKIDIILQELNLKYKEHYVNIAKGEQFKPEFLKISPNNKVPALVDRRGKEPITLFESGAILLYLAEQEGKFIPKDTKGRYEVLKWLFWQVANQGPMQGQFNHFTRYAPEKVPYAIERYTNETNRIYTVLDRQLAKNKYVAGDEYSIADIAIWGWAVELENSPIDMNKFKNVKRWFDELLKRPVVKKVYEKILEQRKVPKKFTEEEYKILFSNKIPE